MLFSLGGNDLMMVGSSSTAMMHIKAQLTFRGNLLHKNNDIYS